MSAFVLAAVLCGALIHASWNAWIKAQNDKFAASMQIAFGTAVVSLPVIAYLPVPPAAAWPFIVASAIIHVGYFALVGLSYRSADLGVAYPLTRGSAPLFTAMFAYLLIGETPGLYGWLAAIAIAAGILSLSADALFRGGLNRATALIAFANACVIVLYTLVDGFGARTAGNALAYIAWVLVFTAMLLMPLMLYLRGRSFLVSLRRNWVYALVFGLSALGSYAIALWAMTLAPIGLVASLRETSVLFAAIIGAILFKEPFGPKRWLSLALIVSGIVMLRLAES